MPSPRCLLPDVSSQMHPPRCFLPDAFSQMPLPKRILPDNKQTCCLGSRVGVIRRNNHCLTPNRGTLQKTSTSTKKWVVLAGACLSRFPASCVCTVLSVFAHVQFSVVKTGIALMCPRSSFLLNVRSGPVVAPENETTLMPSNDFLEKMLNNYGLSMFHYLT